MHTKKIIVLLTVSLIFPLLVNAKRISINKNKVIYKKRRAHPLEQELARNKKGLTRNRTDFNDSLLVLLVEFQEDDNEKTTGNGKFKLEPDPDYKLSFGAPPHDRDYFAAQIEAVKYYWEAASLDYFNLKYDIYPRRGTAYTLPNKMAYYNPDTDDQSLKISRYEEYFSDSFTTADSTSPEIDFSRYSHYMLIHAGSDWQHDVLGDTPCDIPSFFIQVGESKEVYVDNGSVMIDHACNVPEGITQDIYEVDDGYFRGYGVVNGVYAHEFGHSLGMVDLYNTYIFKPEVGYFDIYDSGGSIAILGGEDEEGNLYELEGVLPALPGAWSRVLAWEDEFRDAGILKDINELSLDEPLSLTAAETYREADDKVENPYFIKIPLNEKEYILLENKNLDPDRDGGITFVANSDEGRVILYPSVTDSLLNTRTYEYDWLLPGWIDVYGNSYGGGILAWHINNEVIYDEGVVDSEGNFISNFENNTVNTRHSRRGVRVIEADGLNEIGSIDPYAYYLGTPWEYFFRWKPNFTESGLINHNNPWLANELWRPEFSSNTDPAMETQNGMPSIYSIYNISRPQPVMTFQMGLSLFNKTNKIKNDTSVFSPISRNFLSQPEIMTISPNQFSNNFNINYYARTNNNWQNLDFDNSFTVPKLPDLPITRFDYNNDGFKEYFICADSTLYITNNSPDAHMMETYPVNSEIIDTPIQVENKNSTYFLTTNKLNKIKNGELSSKDLTGTNITYNGNSIVVSNPAEKSLQFINHNETMEIEKEISIPGFDPEYIPVHYQDIDDSTHVITFVVNNKNQIFKIEENEKEMIFDASNYVSKPITQLSLGRFSDHENQTYLSFAGVSKVFAISFDGTHLDNFPLNLENKRIESKSSPRLIEFSDQIIALYKSSEQGYFAISQDGQYLASHSLFWDKSDNSDSFFYDSDQKTLYYSFKENTNLYSSIHQSEDFSSLKAVIWSSNKNGGLSLYQGRNESLPASGEKLNAYAFPNPSSGNNVTIRAENPQGFIKLKIYNVAGDLVFAEDSEPNNINKKDIDWDISNTASGVYFGIVKDKNTTKKIHIAIEK